MATTINFTLDGLYEKALNKIAIANNMVGNEYAESVVKSFLKNHIEGHYQDKFNKLTLINKATLFGDIA